MLIEILVPGDEVRENILGRTGPLPHDHEVQVRVADDLGLTPKIVTRWHERARRDRVGETVVFVPQPEDMFLLFLAEGDVIQARQTKYLACRLHLLHGPWVFDDVDLSAYQRERLGEAAANIINHAAGELEKLHLALHQRL